MWFLIVKERWIPLRAFHLPLWHPRAVQAVMLWPSAGSCGGFWVCASWFHRRKADRCCLLLWILKGLVLSWAKRSAARCGHGWCCSFFSAQTHESFLLLSSSEHSTNSWSGFTRSGGKLEMKGPRGWNSLQRYCMFIVGSAGIMGVYKWVQRDNVYGNMSPEGGYVFKNYLLYIA